MSGDRVYSRLALSDLASALAGGPVEDETRGGRPPHGMILVSAGIPAQGVDNAIIQPDGGQSTDSQCEMAPTLPRVTRTFPSPPDRSWYRRLGPVLPSRDGGSSQPRQRLSRGRCGRRGHGVTVTDELLRHSDATVTIIDRRHAPGGHWLEAYPFVRLHQPSTFYGVTSAPLVQDAFDVTGTNAGFYELASGQRDPRLLRAGHLRRRPNE